MSRCNLAIALSVSFATSVVHADEFELKVKSLRYEGGVFKAVVTLSYSGPPPNTPSVARSTPVWIGVTLRKPRDRMGVDLPAQEIPASQLGKKPLTFVATVGPGFVRYSIAAWGKKLPCAEPGPVDYDDVGYNNAGEWRLRCRQWGYTLSEPLASIPADDYGKWEDASFKAFFPLTVRVLDAGGDGNTSEVMVSRLRRLLPRLLGGRDEIIDGGRAAAPRDITEILYRNEADADLAEHIRRVVAENDGNEHATIRHWPEAPDAFVIAIGK